MVVDDQGFTSIELRKDDIETKGPLCALGDNASTNDATITSRSNPTIENASSSGESSSQSENLATSSEGSIREASGQVQKHHSIIDVTHQIIKVIIVSCQIRDLRDIM